MSFFLAQINSLSYYYLQGVHGSGKSGKNFNYFSLQGKIREFDYGEPKSGKNQGILFWAAKIREKSGNFIFVRKISWKIRMLIWHC